MALSNYERLLQLAAEVFAVKDDPSQLDVDDAVIERLQRMHPATLKAHDTGNGPVAWVLLIPTTLDLMQQFVEGAINERQLFDLTPDQGPYQAVYLCSALVLYEYRRQGITRSLALQAIAHIRQSNPVEALFVWPFSSAGNAASVAIAAEAGLTLYKRIHGHNAAQAE